MKVGDLVKTYMRTSWGKKAIHGIIVSDIHHTSYESFCCILVEGEIITVNSQSLEAINEDR
jgi:hypothetical protein